MRKGFEKDLPTLIDEHNENLGFKLFLEDEEILEDYQKISTPESHSDSENKPMLLEKDEQIINEFIRHIKNYDDSEIRHIHRLACFSHTLQLVINDSIKEDTSVSNFMNKMGRIASATHQCSGLAEKIHMNFKLSIPTTGEKYVKLDALNQSIQKEFETPAKRVNFGVTSNVHVANKEDQTISQNSEYNRFNFEVDSYLSEKNSDSICDILEFWK
ncbi:unnamed protein product, partial [Brachionus calyciflorus]